MKVPVEWLTEYLKIDAPLEEFCERLTMAGLEVEEIEEMSSADILEAGGVNDECDGRIMVTSVTPNRGDWLSMIGVAREAAAMDGVEFKTPSAEAPGSAPSTASQINIRIDDPDLCGRYVGILIRNVTIKESPAWMKNRLIRAGMRPINNVVDITNYLMLEFGQPLHAFDYDLLRGQEIIVRRAKAGETITSIDDIERKLESDMLVIADRDRAVAIAGVMGGVDSEVSAKTRNILLESANFNPVSTRKTSKRLGMVTESSYRFERCVDIGITDLVARRAAELMRDLGDGEIAEGLVDVFPGKPSPKIVDVRPKRVNRILGTALSTEEMVRCLKALRIPAEMGEPMRVTIPTFRPDMTCEIDVIEEIIRVHGYDCLDETLPSAPIQGEDSREGLFDEKLRGVFMSCGLQEAVTHSLMDADAVSMSGITNDRRLTVRNPMSEETSGLRGMIAPNLLQLVVRSQSVGIRDVGVFEIGKIYRRSCDGEIEERRSAAGVMAGSQWASAWNLSKDALAADFYFAKGALESIMERLNVRRTKYEPIEHPLLHPTRGAKVMVDGEEIGILGEVSPIICEKLDIRGRPTLFEFDAAKLMRIIPESVGYHALPKFPALHRHLAVVCGQGVTYEDLKEVVRDAGGKLLEDTALLDVYSGSQIGETERSLTLSFVLRSDERTLTDAEANETLEKIKSRLAAKLGATFRS